MNYNLKNDLIFLNEKDNQKPLLKVFVFFLMFSIINFGGSGIGVTNAYFNDTEESLNNVYRAGTLDFLLEDTGQSEFEIMPAGTATRWLDVDNTGSLPFQYIVRADNLSGELCDSLTIKAILDGVVKQEEALNGFSLDPAVEFSESLYEWQFDIEFSGDPIEHEYDDCSFNLIYDGWQTGVGSYGVSGFKDTEQALTQITLLPEPIPDPEPEPLTSE